MNYILIMLLISGLGLSILQMKIFAYLNIILGICGVIALIKDIIDYYWLD